MTQFDPLICIESEQAVLACALADRSAYNVAVKSLASSGDDFFLGFHGRLFRAIGTFHATKTPIEGNSVFEQLLASGLELGLYGERYASVYIEDLVKMAGTEVQLKDVSHYAAIVHEQALIRRLYQVASEK